MSVSQVKLKSASSRWSSKMHNIHVIEVATKIPIKKIINHKVMIDERSSPTIVQTSSSLRMIGSKEQCDIAQWTGGRQNKQRQVSVPQVRCMVRVPVRRTSLPVDGTFSPVQAPKAGCTAPLLICIHRVTVRP